MEERNLELDDDGKIKLKKAKTLESDGSGDAEDIVIEVPGFEGFAQDDDGTLRSDNELARRSLAQEQERQGRRERAEKTFEEAERLFAEGDLDGAGEKYLDSASLYGADWRPWFGVVRVQTKDLTDFSGIYECEQAYDKAFRRMNAEERAGLAEKYVPSLEKQAAECAQESARLREQDAAEREAARPQVSEQYKKALRRMIVTAVLFAVFAAAAIALAPFVRSVPDASILIPCVICAAAAVVLFVTAAVCLRFFISAKLARSRNLREGTTAAGMRARVCEETEELIRSVLEDLKKQ